MSHRVSLARQDGVGGVGLPLFLSAESIRLVFFCGKGGVGKTTCATSAALRFAIQNPTKSVLILSTDPAHSLKMVLDEGGHPENLSVLELDAASALHAFKEDNESLLKEIADRGTFLDKEDIEKLMSLSMPGMDEVAAYLALSDLVNQDVYDRIFIDTAPTGHTLRLVQMPELAKRWLDALDALLAKHRFMRRRFAKNDVLDHLDQFLLRMNGSIEKFVSSLKNPSLCNFVVVLLAEWMSIAESRDLIKALHEAGMPVREVIINRRVPINHCMSCQDAKHRQDSALRSDWGSLKAFSLWELPLFADEPALERLSGLWNSVSRVTGPPRLSVMAAHLPPHVDRPCAISSLKRQILIFAGKGGVGKTTMACATALRMAAELDGRVLLMSVDPAHSLSDCLGVKIGQKPTVVGENLDAQELNADHLFRMVRDNYRKEIESFLTGVLPHMDVTFDREAIESLLDLAPSGLDEVMALSTLSDHVREDKYAMIVLDSAPSGHMLRLFELPDILESWLKQFFLLLLKYRQVVRLPKVSQQLVKFSRDLKFLRELAGDPGRTAVVTVTHPTDLSVAKTLDMLEQLRVLKMAVELIIVNQLTPRSNCDLCNSLRRREENAIRRLDDHVDVDLLRVARQSDPKGIAGLLALGHRLYQ